MTDEAKIREIVRDEIAKTEAPALEDTSASEDEDTGYSRRDVLQASGLAAGGGLLSALGVFATMPASAQEANPDALHGMDQIGLSDDRVGTIYAETLDITDLVQGDGSDELALALLTTDEIRNQDYNEAVETIDPSGAAETLDLSAANYFEVVLGADTDFSFTATGAAGNSFILYLEQDATGGRTPTWPASVEWAGGEAPDPPADAGNLRLAFTSPDGGTTWRGAEAGRDFA